MKTTLHNSICGVTDWKSRWPREKKKTFPLSYFYIVFFFRKLMEANARYAPTRQAVKETSHKYVYPPLNMDDCWRESSRIRPLFSSRMVCGGGSEFKIEHKVVGASQHRCFTRHPSCTKVWKAKVGRLELSTSEWQQKITPSIRIVH